MSQDVKQVIVWRADLKVRKGKCMAQAAHASVSWLAKRVKIEDSQKEIYLSDAEKQWIGNFFTKIVLQVDNENELLEVFKKAKEADLEVHLIEDMGLTEFHGIPTITCLAIGPDYVDKIDPITGNLKLY